MKTHSVLVVVASAFLLSACLRPAGAAPPPPGQALYQHCSACHGAAGQGNASLAAPAIAGMPAWYVEAQLNKFRAGHRGAHPDDEEGLRMRPMSRQLYTPQEVQLVSLFVSKMPRAAAQPSVVEGDATKGAATWGTCLACHGPDGKGNQAVSAPPLAGQSDWYLLTQLKKFKAGVRGTMPGDATGASMRPMSMILADEQAMKDVVAHIRTFTP